MKKRLIIVIVLSIFFLAKSNAQDNDLGSWNILNLKYKLNDKWTLFGESQLRSLSFYNQFHYYEYKGGVDFKPTKNYKLTLGLGDYNTYKEGGNFKTPMNNDEFRLWPQVTLYQTLGKLKIEQRYRYEMRFSNNNFNSRFRYRIGINYPFGKKDNKPFEVGINNEIFFTDEEPYFVRNRMSTTLSYKLNKSFSFLVGYLHQFDYKINDETGRDFLMIGYYINLN